MRGAIQTGPGLQRSAAAVCAALGAAVVALIAVSLWVPGPPTAPGSSPAAGIVTAVTPTDLGVPPVR
ncbi:hypothetical protein EIL87_04455 [Saccharopolyspora rhizosphaerae]|uniref:Uncharacterized protein n=1 Tax=Saccharopolyspora rhizosphaerae TaxID=2492662 RepID=A0A3R8P4H5_9PSEU|nr:hypothetical protein [Saccharopolyspora rhizosphaerae]RRO19360.1 hypothetical protein EIL87_04455 [Saccharopolyspora rhizosphaerae]